MYIDRTTNVKKTQLSYQHMYIVAHSACRMLPSNTSWHIERVGCYHLHLHHEYFGFSLYINISSTKNDINFFRRRWSAPFTIPIFSHKFCPRPNFVMFSSRNKIRHTQIRGILSIINIHSVWAGSFVCGTHNIQICKWSELETTHNSAMRPFRLRRRRQRWFSGMFGYSGLCMWACTVCSASGLPRYIEGKCTFNKHDTHADQTP